MKEPRRQTSLLHALLALPLVSAPTLAFQCPEWSPDFASPGADAPVRAQATVEIGGSPMLLLGGDFDWIGEIQANHLALWDGSQWSAFAPGVPGPVWALAQYDDGSGSKIYAGGDGFLSAWDGVSWTTFPVLGEVFALHTHDDGNGAALFVGGRMTLIAGNPIRHAARYNGVWRNMKNGVTSHGEVRSFATYDDGSGTDLYVGGSFYHAGGVQARSLALWDGTNFSPVGAQLIGGTHFGTSVRALEVYTPPGGSAELHVGGQFHGVVGMNTSRWIAWQQNAWADIGGGLNVESFALRNTPNGQVLMGSRNGLIDTYDGVSLTTKAFQVQSEVTMVAAFGSGPLQEVFASTESDNETGSHLAKLVGNSWTPLFSGPGSNLGLAAHVSHLTVHDLGQGPRLTVATPDQLPHGGPILQYDGSGWTEVPSTGFNFSFGQVEDSRSFAGDLFFAGDFMAPGGRYAVGQLTNGQWNPLGDPLSSSGVHCRTLEIFDGGSGPEVYMGGYGAAEFGEPGTHGLGKLVGGQWVSAGGGLTESHPTTVAFTVNKLLQWDSPTGSKLYAGGVFNGAGGVSARSIASWDGSTWSNLGGGLTNASANQPTVFDMEIFDGPTGEVLVVTGVFQFASGQVVNSIAAWDGFAWSPMGAGLQNQGLGGWGLTLISHDPDGFGERLYVFGSFDQAGNQSVGNVAEWDGVQWHASTLPNTNQAQVVTYDDGSGRSLFVGGNFSGVGDVGAHNIAKLTDPCGAILGIPQCTSNVNSTGLVGRTRARGTASVSAANLDLESRNLPANTFSLYFAGSGLQHGAVGDGVLCISGSLTRMPPGAFTDASGIVTKSFDFSAPYGNLAVPGQSLIVQCFYRDLAGGPTGFNTTDAIEILMLP